VLFLGINVNHHLFIIKEIMICGTIQPHGGEIFGVRKLSFVIIRVFIRLDNENLSLCVHLDMLF